MPNNCNSCPSTCEGYASDHARCSGDPCGVSDCLWDGSSCYTAPYCNDGACDAGECASGCTSDCSISDCCATTLSSACDSSIGETTTNCASDCCDSSLGNPCGNCGTYDCFGACTGEGVCSPTAPNDCNPDRYQECTTSCAWNNIGIDADQDGVDVQCGDFLCDNVFEVSDSTRTVSEGLACDGIDNDCDGTIDNNLNPALANIQDGVCAGSVKVCNGASGWSEPNYLSYTSFYETFEVSCSDAKDNDCNGDKDCDDSTCSSTPACTAVLTATITVTSSLSSGGNTYYYYDLAINELNGVGITLDRARECFMSGCDAWGDGTLRIEDYGQFTGSSNWYWSNNELNKYWLEYAGTDDNGNYVSVSSNRLSHP